VAQSVGPEFKPQYCKNKKQQQQKQVEALFAVQDGKDNVSCRVEYG
jgi:hypothetical protein